MHPVRHQQGKKFQISTGNADKKGFWREVGVVWQHKNGKGVDVVIDGQIGASGWIWQDVIQVPSPLSFRENDND
jgi:hypothetical protein